MNDIFHRLYTWYVDWAGGISDDTLIMMVRLALLFVVPTVILYWTFMNNRREGPLRFIASFLADGIVLALPLRAPYDMTARAWILTISVIALAYLPSALPLLMVREAGCQRRLRSGLYYLAGSLLLVGIFWS